MNFQAIFNDISGDIWQKTVKIGKNTEGVIQLDLDKKSQIKL
jgi:hypothetical protein